MIDNQRAKINIYMLESQKQFLIKYARTKGMNPSEFIRNILDKLENYDPAQNNTQQFQSIHRETHIQSKHKSGGNLRNGY